MLARVIHLTLRRAALTPVPAPPSLAPMREALARAEGLLAPSIAKLAEVIPLHPGPLPEESSAWDPEPVQFHVVALITPREDELLQQEINGCKTLLLEIIRRAAYDYVLYRSSRRMAQKVLAEQAYRWLFTEVAGSADSQERAREGKHITGFESICESLDLDPDTVRGHIKRLTPRHVMSVGRPAEYRRRDVFQAARGGDEDAYSLPDGLVSLDDDPSGSDGF